MNNFKVRIDIWTDDPTSNDLELWVSRAFDAPDDLLIAPLSDARQDAVMQRVCSYFTEAYRELSTELEEKKKNG
jgi:hypothetical protein